MIKKSLILEHSTRIKTLLDLNQKIHFKRIKSVYNNHKICTSKRQLDNLYMENYLIGLIRSNEAFYKNIIESILSNRTHYSYYINQVHQIKSSITKEFCDSIGVSLEKFKKIEDRIFRRNLLKAPQFEIKVYCKATYTSPKGRNHYWTDKTFSFEELNALFEQAVGYKLISTPLAGNTVNEFGFSSDILKKPKDYSWILKACKTIFSIILTIVSVAIALLLLVIGFFVGFFSRDFTNPLIIGAKRTINRKW